MRTVGGEEAVTIVSKFGQPGVGGWSSAKQSLFPRISSVAVSMAKCSENSLAPNAHPARGVRVTGGDHVSVIMSL